MPTILMAVPVLFLYAYTPPPPILTQAMASRIRGCLPFILKPRGSVSLFFKIIQTNFPFVPVQPHGAVGVINIFHDKNVLLLDKV